MHPQRVLLLLAALVVPLLVAAPARAWVESHVAGDDVHIKVDATGKAVVEHQLTVRVLKGPLRGFDVGPVEKVAKPEADVAVTTEDGRALTAHAQKENEGDTTIRVAVDEPRAMMRGKYMFRLRYAVDLRAAGELTRDGAMWRLAWTAPAASEGLDGSKFVFELPPAPTGPRAVNVETGAPLEGLLADLRRAPDADTLELVKPHVARGEAVTWAVRVDPKAFPSVDDPVLRPPPIAASPPPDRTRDVAMVVALAGLGLAYALLVLHKARAFAGACAAAAAGRPGDRPAAALEPRGLIPVPATLRALLAGAALSAGVALQGLALPTAGACAVALAMVLAVLRPPVFRPAARGPGKWLAVRPEEAFARSARRGGHWLDVGSRAGKITLACFGLLLAAAALVARRFDAWAPYLVALDGAALLPLFFTGRAAQLPPDGGDAPVPALRALYRRLTRKKTAILKAVPWMRVPLGASEADELRLLVLPRLAMPGLLGIEVGLAWARTPSGFSGAPEVLVRYQECSAASQRLAGLVPGVRPVPGRREGERVVRLVAQIATRAGTAGLVERLVDGLADRRVRVPASAARPWEGIERRVPPMAPGVAPSPAPRA